ncbi:MAG TPA: serine/threonine-protein kinase, partial [Planctomycetota bacterium]|nr:serine/threonine-protein kinase [Planctomycetota bacterium]
ARVPQAGSGHPVAASASTPAPPTKDVRVTAATPPGAPLTASGPAAGATPAAPSAETPEPSRRDLPDRAVHPPMPAFQAAVIIEKCARALAHAHARGIIHRDLKPGNILMRAADDPVVLDFGLARQVALDEAAADGDAGPEGRLTVMGQVLGTPAYMAPEQARGEIDLIDELSDTYSLAAILYEMLTGREVLSPSRTIGEALHKIQSEEPVPPSRFVKRVPGDLETITLKALQKERSQRYANAEAFAEDLRRLREGEPILARPQGLLYRTYKFVEKHRLQLSVAGLVTVFFLILLGSVIWRGIQKERADRDTIEQQLVDLQKERAAREKKDRELDNLLGNLLVNEFKDDFTKPDDFSSEDSKYRLCPPVLPREGAGGASNGVGNGGEGPNGATGPVRPVVAGRFAGYWRILRGRLNGRAGVKHSAAEADEGLLYLNRPLVGDVTIKYEISATPVSGETVPEIAFVLDSQPSRNVDGGYFVSVKPNDSRVRRLGAEVHGGPGYADLVAGRRYAVRVEKVDDRLLVFIKPAESGEAVAETKVVDFRDPDPISGEDLNRFGWYIWRSEVQIFNFTVSRPVPARPRPIHFAHKLFNRGEYAMARAEYTEVSRIGFGTRGVEDANAELKWILDDGVEADYRIALCYERLADHEANKARAEHLLGDAEAGYKSFLYEHRAAPGQPEPYPKLHALALAHLAMCYIKRGWQPQADDIVKQLAEFSQGKPATTSSRAPVAGEDVNAGDAGWSVLAEFELSEAARPPEFAPGDGVPVPAAEMLKRQHRVAGFFVRAAEFAEHIREPKLSEETAKSILQAIRMSDRLSHSDPFYVETVGRVYAALGRCAFRAPDMFLAQLSFHEDDLKPTLFDALVELARARQAAAGQLEAHRVIRLCDREDVEPTEKIAALKACFDLPGADLGATVRLGELARDLQSFELAHQYFERALHENASDRRKRDIYRGLGCAMFDNGERVKDASQRVRGIADLLAAADFNGDPDVLDDEAIRLEGFLFQHPAEAADLEAYLKNTCPPAVAARRWGLFCLCGGRRAEALVALKASCGAEADNALGVYLLAVAQSQVDQPAAAAALLEGARSRWPSSAVLESLAALDLAMEDYPAALKVCQQANDLRPFNETAAARGAYALARLGRWPDAVPQALLARDLDSHNRPALVVAMGAAAKRGDRAAAEGFERQLGELPNLSQLNLDSRIRQNTRIKLPREIGFANANLQSLNELFPAPPPGPTQ